jgi:microcystin-dependent protein
MVWRWSKISASNATADSTINWAEGQAPSSINDSARAEMARVAQWRDDISGAILTTGTSAAYAISTNQVFDTQAHVKDQMLAFTPHATNTGACTLNVDSVGGTWIRAAPGVDLPSGTLITGTPYVVVYNSTDGVYYLQGGLSNPYGIPLAGGIDYWGATAPNSAFAFPFGQAISRTIYSGLFSLIGTTFGVGDNSTTFNLPDKRGLVSAASDNLGGTSASRISLTYGVTGGVSAVGIAQGNLPAVNLTGAAVAVSASGTTSIESALHSHTGSGNTFGMNRSNPHNHGTNATFLGAGNNGFQTSAGVSIGVAANTATDIDHEHAYSFTTSTESAAHSHTVTVGGVTTGLSVALGGSGIGLSVMQPTIACNYILRII